MNGKYGRFTFSDEEKTIEMNNLSDINMKGLINTVRIALVQIELDQEDTDLLNIRDEMLSDVNKLSYLLSLE